MINNSNLYAPSIAIHTESRLKQLTEHQDKSFYAFENDANNFDTMASIKINQNARIFKWAQIRRQVHTTKMQEIDSTKNSNFYMLQIQQVGEIHYRRKFAKQQRQSRQSRTFDKNKDTKGRIQQSYYKKQQQELSKVYLKVFACYQSPTIQFQSSRTVQLNLIELQQKSSSIFQSDDLGFALFMHSRHTPDQKYKIKIDLYVVESVNANGNQVVAGEQYIGFVQIDATRGLKSSQKCQLFSQKSQTQIDTFISYSILNSDAFKILQKLIPSSCLFSSQDIIAGLAGRKLPNDISRFHYQIQYTQLHSMRIDVLSVDIPQNYLQFKIKQIQQTLKHLYNVANVQANIKQVRLLAYFHNGWTVFSEGSAKLSDKMEIQRKNSKKAGQIVKIRHYTTEQICTLPFIFMDEEGVLILQIQAKIQAKSKNDVTIFQNFTVPVCYAYYTIQKITVDDKQTKHLTAGDGLTLQNLNNNNKKSEQSSIQFYVNIEHANKLELSKHLITHNRSHTKLHTEVERIAIEKQRIIRENRKLKHENRAKKIQLNQEIPILDMNAFRQNLYKGEIQRIKQERRQKQEILQYLKKKLQQLSPSFTTYGGIKQIKDQDKSIDQSQVFQNQRIFAKKLNPQLFKNSIFYKVALEKNIQNSKTVEFITNLQAIRVRPLPIFLNRQAATLYQSGEVPLDIIKTQMLQKNYSYAIFINWISLLPVTEDLKMPRNFYFSTSFFNKTNLKTTTCTINPSNGQIQVVQQHSNHQQNNQKPQKQSKQFKRTTPKNSQQQKQQTETKQKSQKILYIEFAPDSKLANSNNTFIDFISYLYHSQIQIKIIDSFSQIQFGECFVKLRELIRMRRNQVSAFKELWVSSGNQIKGKLKIQIKAIRKQVAAQQKKSKVITQLQVMSMTPQARQLQRIAMLKKQRENQQSSSLAKVQKILNEDLTKSQITINVSRMKTQIIQLQIVNRKNYTQSYRIVINDPDSTYLKKQQLVVINRQLFSTLQQTRWWKYLSAVQNNRFNKCTIVDDGNTFQLQSGQITTILLYYYSQRKFQGYFDKQNMTQFSQNDQKQPHLLQIYNRSRCIDLTLTNPNNNSLQSLHKININSAPDHFQLSYKLTRKQNSKLYIQVPYLPEHNCVIYIDDPTIIVTLDENQGCVGLDCYSPAQGNSNIFNVSVLSPFPENRMLGNYRFQVSGAKQILVKGELFQERVVLLDLHSAICLKMELAYILVLSGNQKAVEIKDKNPIKVNQKQAKTMIRAQILTYLLGTNYYEIKVLNPNNYSLIYKYVIKVVTNTPEITQKITLRIKLTDSLLEQAFGFKNNSIKKQRYKVLSTHPHILWSSQELLQVQAKSEKRIKLKINAEELQKNEQIILTFFSQLQKHNYLFVLQLQ